MGTDEYGEVRRRAQAKTIGAQGPPQRLFVNLKRPRAIHRLVFVCPSASPPAITAEKRWFERMGTDEYGEVRRRAQAKTIGAQGPPQRLFVNLKRPRSLLRPVSICPPATPARDHGGKGVVKYGEVRMGTERYGGGAQGKADGAQGTMQQSVCARNRAQLQSPALVPEGRNCGSFARTRGKRVVKSSNRVYIVWIAT